MICKSWRTISEDTFYKALARAKKQILSGEEGITFIETDEFGYEEFCLNGFGYRNFLGTYEKGKIVL